MTHARSIALSLAGLAALCGCAAPYRVEAEYSETYAPPSRTYYYEPAETNYIYYDERPNVRVRRRYYHDHGRTYYHRDDHPRSKRVYFDRKRAVRPPPSPKRLLDEIPGPHQLLR